MIQKHKCIPFPLMDCEWSPELEINMPFNEKRMLHKLNCSVAKTSNAAI